MSASYLPARASVTPTRASPTLAKAVVTSIYTRLSIRSLFRKTTAKRWLLDSSRRLVLLLVLCSSRRCQCHHPARRRATSSLAPTTIAPMWSQRLHQAARQQIGHQLRCHGLTHHLQQSKVSAVPQSSVREARTVGTALGTALFSHLLSPWNTAIPLRLQSQRLRRRRLGSGLSTRTGGTRHTEEHHIGWVGG